MHKFAVSSGERTESFEALFARMFLSLVLCITALCGQAAAQGRRELGLREAADPKAPSNARHAREGLEALERNPDAVRDAQGRLLFHQDGRVGLKSEIAADKVSGSHDNDRAKRMKPAQVIVRLAAPGAPAAQGGATTARVDLDGLLRESGADWSKRRALLPPAAASKASVSRAAGEPESASESMKERWSRTFVVPVEGPNAVPKVLKMLEGVPGVEFAQPSFTYEATVMDDVESVRTGLQPAVRGGQALPSAESQSAVAPWGIDAVQARQAWATSRGKGVVVAVVDSGVNRFHSQLRDNIWRNRQEVAGNCIDDDGNGYVDDVYGWAFADQELSRFDLPIRVPQQCEGLGPVFNETMDFHSHGSHVAGTIAAAGRGSAVVGVSPAVTIMPVKGLSNFGFGLTEGLAQSLIYATDNGAHVINNSWGYGYQFGQFANDHILQEAIQYAADRGVVVVFAAGNDELIKDAAFNPELSRDVLVVGALRRSTDIYPSSVPTYRSGGALELASFSSRGLVLDVSAPGVSVLSTLGYLCGDEISEFGDCEFSESGGSYFAEFSGTSMAAPHVAGVAALVRSVNPNLTAAQVRAIIRASAQRSERISGPDPFFGAGTVNAAQAVAVARFGNAHSLVIKSSEPVVTVSMNRALEVRGEILNAAAYSATLYRYDGTIGSGRTVQGTPLGVRTRIPVGNNVLLWSLPTAGLKSGRYALTLTVIGRDGRTSSDSVPFVVEGSEVSTIAEVAKGDYALCLRAKGDVVAWFEVGGSVFTPNGLLLDRWGDATVSLKVANLKTGTRTTLFSFQGEEVNSDGNGVRDNTSSCPLILEDGRTVVWLTSSVNWDSVFVPGVQGDEYRAALYRADVGSRSVSSAPLPGFAMPVEDLRFERKGFSSNGSELLLLEEELGAEDTELTWPDGSPRLTVFSKTRLHHIAAQSSSPTLVVEDGQSWFFNRFLAGPLGSREAAVMGLRRPEGASAGDWFAANVSLSSGAFSTAGWFTPVVKDVLGYELTFSQPDGDLIAAKHNVPPEYTPPIWQNRFRPGISLVNLRSGVVFPVSSQRLVGAAGLGSSRLAWIVFDIDKLPMWRVETLNLRTAARATIEPGFPWSLTEIAPNANGVALISISESMRVRLYK